jgi:hypothetical protein
MIGEQRRTRITPEGDRKMFDAQKLKDPGYYRENRLDAHSDHRFYATEEER